MPRTTRATRQQLDADGKQISPLVALDDNPRRRKPPSRKQLVDERGEHRKHSKTEKVERALAKPAKGRSVEAKRNTPPTRKVTGTTPGNSLSAEISDLIKTPKIETPHVHQATPCPVADNTMALTQESALKRSRNSPGLTYDPFLDRVASDFEDTPSGSYRKKQKKVHWKLPDDFELSVATGTDLVAPSFPKSKTVSREDMSPPTGKGGITRNRESTHDGFLAAELVESVPSKQGMTLPSAIPNTSHDRKLTNRSLAEDVLVKQAPKTPHKNVMVDDDLPEDSALLTPFLGNTPNSIISDSGVDFGLIADEKPTTVDYYTGKARRVKTSDTRRIPGLAAHMRKMHEEATVYVKFWIDTKNFATYQERKLEGTYILPKIAFLDFFARLPEKDRVLTTTDHPEDQISEPDSIESSPAAEESIRVEKTVTSSQNTRPTSLHKDPPEAISRARSKLPKRKADGDASGEGRLPPSKRQRPEPKANTMENRIPAKSTLSRPQPINQTKRKRYAREGGYDKNGNLLFPGQELLDSTDDDSEMSDHVAKTIDVVQVAAVQPSPHMPRTPSLPRGFATNLSQTHREMPNTNTPTSAPTGRANHALQSARPRTAPRRGWDLTNKVTNSIGRFMPFGFFSRSTEVEPDSGTGNNESLELTVSRERVSTPTDPEDQNRQTDSLAPEKTDSPSQLPDLLFSMLQLKCPDIANERLVSTVQLSLAQRESALRHKAEAAQKQLDSITDPHTQKLLPLLQQQYPDLTAVEILSKLEELITQQQILAKFELEKANKHKENSQPMSKGEKRKRRESVDVIPNPKGASYGMDLAFFGDSSDEESDDEGIRQFPVMDEISRPAKKPRIEERTPSKAESIGDPKRATPYQGKLFSDPHSQDEVIFPPPQLQDGSHFEVPSSSSEDEDEAQTPPPSQPLSTSTDVSTSKPPPAPIPSHAALPNAASAGQAINLSTTQTPHDPVALARAQANKYAPKTSSKLKSVSRLSNSPATSGMQIIDVAGGHELDRARDQGLELIGGQRINVPDEHAKRVANFPFISIASLDLDPDIAPTVRQQELSFLRDPLEYMELDPVARQYIEAIERANYYD